MCEYGTQLREPKEPVMIEEYEDIVRFDMEDVEVELEEVTIEDIEMEKTETPQMISLGEFRLTAYCACNSCTDGDGLTALNIPPVEGRTIAVDPSVIPYGTTVIINGHEYVAEDSGGKWIVGNEIDIYFDCHEETDEFGIQYAEVYVKHQEGECEVK